MQAMHTVCNSEETLSEISIMMNPRYLETFANDLVRSCISEVLKAESIKKILCVGVVCLDLITVCERYPDEDTETSAIEHYWSRGGNAANIATVLAHLGANVEFFGTLVENRWLDFLKSDFEENGVYINNCVYLDSAYHKFPVGTFIISQRTGTRTAITSVRNETELTFDDFDKLNLQNYDWIHFEERPNVTDTEKMINKIIEFNKKSSSVNEEITISVKMQPLISVRPEHWSLFAKADVVLVSKDYARDAKYTSKEGFVDDFYDKCKTGAILVCTWGDEGAAARSAEGKFVSSAFIPETLVDTLGVGDTFKASIIYALRIGESIRYALEFACRVAGGKCSNRGFAAVKDMQQVITS